LVLYIKRAYMGKGAGGRRPFPLFFSNIKQHLKIIKDMKGKRRR